LKLPHFTMRSIGFPHFAMRSLGFPYFPTGSLGTTTTGLEKHSYLCLAHH